MLLTALVGAAAGSILGANAKYIKVTVGEGGHAFEPDSVEADVGDIITWEFYPLNHSVIRSAYGYPCIPIETSIGEGPAFFSGFMPVAAITDDMPTWSYKVQTSDPIFYYCGAPGSCTDWAMLGVINPNSSTSLDTQKDLAKQANYMLLPGEQFPNEKEQFSLSKLAHTATEYETVTAGATPAPAASSIAPHPHPDDDDDDGGSSGLSTGAVAGIAVGAAVVALIVVALFMLMRRTKKLKKKLEDEKASTAARHRSETQSMNSNVYGNYYDQNRPHSHLPPYQQHQTGDAYVYDPNKPEGWNEQQSPGRTMSPPLPGQQHMGAPSPGPNQRYSQSTTSEMQGPFRPPIELDTSLKR